MSFREHVIAYLIKLRPFVVHALAVFVLGVIGGMATPQLLPHFTESVDTQLSELASTFADATPWELLWMILLNNVVKVFAVIILGVVFAVIPYLFLLGNGFVLGLVAAHAVATHGIAYFVGAVMPHGVLEIPALLIAAAAGIRLGMHVLDRWRGITRVPLLTEMGDALRVFVGVVLPLLLVAGLIETFVTPFLIS